MTVNNAPQYCWAELPHAGLGNRLATWARAEIYGHRHGLTTLPPVWSKLSVGPVLRRERDWRTYTGAFVGDNLSAHLHKIWLKTCYQTVVDPELDAPPLPGSIAVFRGYHRFFEGFFDREDFLADRLNTAVRPAVLRAVREVGQPDVVLHVRRGDGFEWMRTPEAWYTAMLDALTEVAGRPLTTVLFSDGADAELGQLLARPNLHRGETGTAVGDILAMARGRVLLSSGLSSFSTWAAFLGGMPAAAPAEWRGNFEFTPPPDQVTTAETPPVLSEAFASAVLDALDGASAVLPDRI